MTESNTVNNGLETALNLSEQMMPGEIFANSTPYMLTLNYITLANTYKSNGFAKLAVDLPVSDCFRDGGYILNSSTLSAEELQELQDYMEEHDTETIKQCLRWGRLYGGGLVICSTEQQPDTPFNPKTIYKKDVEFYACDRWQCVPNSDNVNMADSFCLQDNFLEEQTGNLFTFDKSRVKVFVGEVQPYYLRNLLQGWGASIFEAIIPQLNQYLKANSVILELLDEAKIDILKIFELSSVLSSPGGEAAIKKRAEIFAQQKNYKNMGVMDTQDDYIQKTMSFSGLNEILEKIFLLICSSLRIPYSKVFGRGAAGFSSGEDDLENYNGMIMSELRVPAQPLIKWIANIRCCQLFGRVIDDLSITWKPLRVLTEKEQAELNTSKINALNTLLMAGVLTRSQVAKKLVQDEIIALTDEEINAIDDEMDMSGIGDYENGNQNFTGDKV